VTPRIRTVIADDERLARASVRVLLAADDDIEIVAECASGRDAARAIGALAPDLVFLDVEMPRASGLDVLRGAGARPPAVVFVTAFDSYAAAAFDVQAIDYVLKPFDDRRFARAVERAKERIRSARFEGLASQLLAALPPAAAPAAPRAASADRLLVRDAGRTVVVDVAEIDWIEAYDYYAQLHVGARTYLLRESMRDLETRLDPRRFVRIHRSAIVSLDRIAQMWPTANGDYAIRLRDGTDLKLSRARRAHLRGVLPTRAR
jgi:two-component system LytT family response regulator